MKETEDKMVDARISEGISEVLVILKSIDNIYTEKLPQKFKDFLNNNQSSTYTPDIDLSKELKDMNLKKETRNILELMYLNYWSTTEEKKEFMAILSENERKYQEEIKEKYNPDNLFKNKKDTSKTIEETVTEEVALVEYNESLFKKIWDKIISIFKK